MSNKCVLFVALAALALSTGCKSKEEQKPTAPPPAPSTPTPAAGNVAVPSVPTLPAVTVPTTLPVTVPATLPPVPPVSLPTTLPAPTLPAATTTATVPAAVSTNTQQAQSLLDQVVQYIKDKKFDLAEQGLTKLEGMKGSLPESLQKQTAQARVALSAAKAVSGSGLKLP